MTVILSESARPIHSQNDYDMKEIVSTSTINKSKKCESESINTVLSSNDDKNICSEKNACSINDCSENTIKNPILVANTDGEKLRDQVITKLDVKELHQTTDFSSNHNHSIELGESIVLHDGTNQCTSKSAISTDEELQNVYRDLCSAKLAVKHWKTRAIRAEIQVAQLQEQYTRENRKNSKLQEERKVLVRAYKSLHAEKQKSLIDHIEDYVVNAITMHEQLLKCQTKWQTVDKIPQNNISNEQSDAEVLKTVLSNPSMTHCQVEDQLDAGIVIDNETHKNISSDVPLRMPIQETKFPHHSKPSIPNLTTQVVEVAIDPTNTANVLSSSICSNNTSKKITFNSLPNVFNNLHQSAQETDSSFQKHEIKQTTPKVLEEPIDSPTNTNNATKDDSIDATDPSANNINKNSTKQDTCTPVNQRPANQQPVIRMAMRSNAWIQPTFLPPSFESQQNDQKSLGARFLSFLNPSFGDEQEKSTPDGKNLTNPPVKATESTLSTNQPLIRLQDLLDKTLDKTGHGSHEVEIGTQLRQDDDQDNLNEKCHRFQIQSNIGNKCGTAPNGCNNSSPASVLEYSKANNIQSLKSLSIPVDFAEH
jgi:hypothetical protein